MNVFARLIFCLSIFAWGLTSYAQSGTDALPSGWQNWERQCYQEGQAGACNNLGRQYYDGIGVNKDVAKAARHYLENCKFGTITGCENAVMIYRDEIKDLKGYGEALSWGCSADDIRFCKEYFFAANRPDDPIFNPDGAGKIVIVSCRLGDPYMCLLAGRWWGGYNDKDVPGLEAIRRRDGMSAVHSTSRAAFARACNSELRGEYFDADNRIYACERAYHAYVSDTHNPADFVKAKEVAMTGCDKGSESLCNRMSTYLYTPEDPGNPGFTKDLSGAAKAGTKYCAMGTDYGCQVAASAYISIGTDESYKSAYPFLRDWCMKDKNPDACVNASRIGYDYGSPSEKIELDKAACETASDGWACYSVAMQALRLSKQYSYAEGALKKSCNAGFSQACEYMAEHKARRARSAAQTQRYYEQQQAQYEAQRRAQSQRPAYTPKFTYSGGGGFGTGSSFKPSYQQCVGNSYLSGCARFD